MACACRRVELPGTGKAKPIKGIIYCKECVENAGKSNEAFKALLIDTLKQEVTEIGELAKGLTASLDDQMNVN